MNQPDVHLNPGEPLSRSAALRDILIAGAPIVLLGVVGNLVGLSTLVGGAIINVGYVVMMIVGGYLLKRRGRSWRDIGLARPPSVFKTIFGGLGALVAAVLIFVVTQGLAVVLLNAVGLTPTEIDQSRFNQIEGNLPLFGLLVVLAWTTIAFGEEMFFRAFIISRLSDATVKPGVAVLFSGIVFGAAHFAEGPLGLLSNGAFGLLFGWIYVRSGRNLWITIIAHGLLNTLRFWLLYSGNA